MVPFVPRKNDRAKFQSAIRELRLKTVEKIALGIALLSFSFALCLSVEAQPTKVIRIGVLDPGSPSVGMGRWNGFRAKLRALGHVEGQNIAFEYRFAEGKFARLTEFAAELVRLKVDVIASSGGVAGQAAKNATSSIPIVMEAGDPVRFGLIASLARPGGNVTGLASFSVDLAGKRIELLREVLPKLARVAVFWNRGSPIQQIQVRETEAVAHVLKIQSYAISVQSADDLDSAFSNAAKNRSQALLVVQSSFFSDERTKLVAQATKHRLPAMYGNTLIAEAGGMMCYGMAADDLFPRMALYVDKILKGAKPADLPVQQPMKFELIINMKSAEEIGLTIPPNVLARADRVIR